jgi:hypothetical protein
MSNNSPIAIDSSEATSSENYIGNETEDYAGDEDLTEDYDCPRGIPEPVLDEKKFPGRTFRLQEDRTGLEKFNFSNGDKLTITNSGCEYIMLTFRFETKKFSGDTTDLKYWSESAVKLFNGIKKNCKTSFDWDKGLQALKNFYSVNTPESQTGPEIDFGGEDIRSFVSFDRIEQINEKEFAVTVSFGVGPL